MKGGGVIGASIAYFLSCRGVKATKVELALLAPKATSVSARLGPYGLRC